MRFFSDHCVPRSFGDRLESDGHEVVQLSARLRADADDSAVIEEAQKIGAILLSLNGDIADLLRYPPEEYGGIVALQVRNRPEAIPSIMDRLNGYLEQHPHRSHYRTDEAALNRQHGVSHESPSGRLPNASAPWSLSGFAFHGPGLRKSPGIIAVFL